MFGETMFPMTTFEDLRREMNRLFDARFRGTNGGFVPRTRVFPPLNVWEDNDKLLVEAETPGLSMSDVEVEVIGNELTIKGERKPFEGQEFTYHRQERGTGSFTRSLTLPTDRGERRQGRGHAQGWRADHHAAQGRDRKAA